MNPKLHQVAVCLDAAEYRQFKFWVSARGVSQSAYIREQLSFDVKPRGAPIRSAEETQSRTAEEERGPAKGEVRQTAFEFD